MNSPRRKRLAQQTIQNLLSKSMEEGRRQSKSGDCAGSEQSGDIASFKRKSVQRGSQRSRGSVLNLTFFPVAADTGSEGMLGVADEPPQHPTEVQPERADMKRIAHHRIKRIQARTQEKLEATALQRRFASLDPAEKDFLMKVFLRFDADCSGTLDWDEVLACLRELGLAGTNTQEKREIIKVCRDTHNANGVQDSAKMTQLQETQRQETAQAQLRQHRKGPLQRQQTRSKASKFDPEGISTEDVTKAFISKRDLEEDRAKAKAMKEMNEARNFNKFVIFSAAMDNLSSDIDKTPPATKQTSSNFAMEGAEDHDFFMTSESEASKAGSEAEDARSENGEFNTCTDSKFEFDANAVSFDFFSFAVLVVPRVRQRLREMRNSKMLRLFCHFDRDGEGSLSLAQCEEIGRCLGIDTQLLTEILQANKSSKGGHVRFEALEKSVMACKEVSERSVRDSENKVWDETGISQNIFEEFRLVIVQVHQVFQASSHVDDQSGERVITTTNAFELLRELGFMPKTNWEREHFRKLLLRPDLMNDQADYFDRDAFECEELELKDLDFEHFLMFLRQVREYYKAKRVNELRQLFDEIDADHSNSLDVAEVSILLERLDSLPRNRKEQEELGQLIQSVDEDGNGSLDFEEFQALVQRIEEKFASMRYEQELEHALAAGFHESQLGELRSIFELTDADGSGTLEVHEVRTCVNLMEKPVSHETFDHAWRKLDMDESGSLDFCEFVDLMQILKDGHGMFEDGAHKVPAELCLLDDKTLRSLLGNLNFPSSYLWCLERRGLVGLASASLGILKDDNLYDKLGVRTHAELIQYAKAQCCHAAVHMPS